VIRGGLERTAVLWPEVRAGFAILGDMATVLSNESLLWGHEVRAGFEAVVGRAKQAAVGARACGQEKLPAALEHFVTVCASYEPGLFYCYDVADVPPTNNDLEQLFGCLRHHTRRVSGQKKGRASLVLRGSVRVVALVATRTRDITAEDLVVSDIHKWQQKREELKRRQHKRALQMQFRKDPEAFLKRLEDMLARANERDHNAQQQPQKTGSNDQTDTS
jgi:hypothetical protein